MSSKETLKKDLSYLPLLRNVGIIAHIDSGKTTTTERVLYLCKQIHKIGEVHEGSTQTDFMDLEKERGITICSACVTVNWVRCRSVENKEEKEKYKLNIIDTPGHLDFKAEVERCLRVLDGVVLVMDGKEGVEPQTETVWQQANKYSIPRIVFVNKMDGVENEQRFDKCLSSLQEVLKANPLAVQIPIGAGKEFKGVVDIIEKKAYFFSFGDKEEKFETSFSIPPYLLPRVESFHHRLLDVLITYSEDEQLVLDYLEGKKGLEPKVIRMLLRKAALTGKIFPVFCGSAYQDVGVNLLLDGVIDYLPSPVDMPAVPLFSLADNNSELTPIKTVACCDPFSYLALAFKVTVDSYGNTITFIRVYAGQIVNNSYIYNVTKQKEERVATLVRMNAEEEVKIDAVKAGEIAAIKNLKFTRTGDTFSSEKKEQFVLEPIIFDKPVISKAVVPQTSKDGEKLIEALKKMCVEDPSVSFLKDDRSGQIVVQGMGELHLEILEENLRRKYKLNITTESPRISYRETIKNKCKVTTRYKKQSGGHGHFAEITVLFEPNPGKGFEFLNKIRGEAVSKNFAEAVGKGLEEAMGNGLLLGYPVVDTKVSLLDGVSHTVDSSDKDFKQVAIISCRENKDKLGLTLLEPIMQVTVFVPKDYMGDVLANLGSLRMVIENTEEEEETETVKIIGKAPLERMLGYTTSLRRITKGRGRCIMSLSHYQDVPQELLQKLLKEQGAVS